jgi:integrase
VDCAPSASAPKGPAKRKKAARKRLTDFALKHLEPAVKGTRYEVWDLETPGLGVRVTENGVRTFFVLRRLRHGKPVRVTLGTYPLMKLKDARDRADDVRRDLRGGVHPKDKEEAKRREEKAKEREDARRRNGTFSIVAEAFLERHAKKLRTFHEIEIVVRRDLIPRWSDRPITEITRRDVVELVREIIDRGEGKRRGLVSYAAHHALAYARRLFNWAIGQDIYELEASPCDRVSAKDLIGAKEKRKRVLTDHEIRLVWEGAGLLGYPIAQFVRLLLVTGQRLEEVTGAGWREIESLRVVTEGDGRRVDAGEALWTIPEERMKGKIAQEVPLSALASKLFASIPRFQGGSFMFTTTGGKRPVSGFSKFKARLDKVMLKAHRRALGMPEDDDELRRSLRLPAGEPLPPEYQIEPWRFHDLRRTVRTRLSGLKDAQGLPIPEEVRELMIAHGRSALHQIYDQHEYRDEKRRGFELWAERLLAIVNGHPEDQALRGDPPAPLAGDRTEAGKPSARDNVVPIGPAWPRHLRVGQGATPD